ncbi:Lrp/AsnC family transcriptional regulator, partial [Candidatus Woesearchaeota archaeon]|nr:Lrp/AsnC family transcriptional regulator [Candidatus Woesearchaeota archaeon]
KVSFVTVMNRIKKLEQAGVIQEYSVKVNYNELGYDIHAIIELNIERGKWDDYERKILPLVNIYSAYEVTGETDVLLMLRFKNTKELGDFLEKLQSFGFIKSSNTKLVTYTDKDEFIKI